MARRPSDDAAQKQLSFNYSENRKACTKSVLVLQCDGLTVCWPYSVMALQCAGLTV